MRAYLGLGSNLGDRWMYLRDAVNNLPDKLRWSPVYESEAMGGPPGQGPYLNLVVEMETGLGPRDLLRLGRGLELTAGRRQAAERWSPRTLDVDVLLVEDLEVNEPDLQIPHPRMWERPFVIVPLNDVAPTRVPAPLLEWAREQVEQIGVI